MGYAIRGHRSGCACLHRLNKGESDKRDIAGRLEGSGRLTVDEVRQHDSDSDEHLEETHNSSTDVLGGALRHVDGSDG
jgi:hypothetical protein